MGTPGGKPEMLLVRYYGASEPDGEKLKATLEKAKGVDHVSLERSAPKAWIDWRGGCRALAVLESTAAAAGVPAYVINHAHVTVSLKAVVTNASPKALWDQVHAISGVKGAVVTASTTQIHADLSLLAVHELRAALRAAGYEGTLTTHIWAEIPVEAGDAEKFEKELAGVRGVMVIKRENNRIRTWAAKGLTENAVKAAADEAGVKLGKITYP